MINENEIALFLKTDACNEQNVALLSNKEFNKDDKYDFFTIKEWDAVTFKYPVIILLKGCLEVINIDLSNMKIYYYKLASPFCIFT